MIAVGRLFESFRDLALNRFCPHQAPDALSLEDIQLVLRDTPLAARYLELELTESALMAETATTTRLLKILKDAGIVLKVDDFGTGPSSLSYLQRCPVDVLKIDQSFVQGIAPSPLVRAMIAMAKSLGCRVVAEGVETGAQLTYLRAEQCDEGQGFHFSPAVDADAFGRLFSLAPCGSGLGAVVRTSLSANCASN